MVKDHLQSEIVRILDLYEELFKQHDFNKAGDIYRIFMYQVLKKLTKDETIFKQIVDELLFLHDKPHVQIEIASEAIGKDYRREEAIEILEKIATWTPEMTIQSVNGKNCNTAQHRLQNLLGYSYDTTNQTWERPEKIEITSIYQKFFDDRAKSGINVSDQRVGVTKNEQQIQISEITTIYVNDTDDFLFSCITAEGEQRYILISTEGELLTVYPHFQMMEPFKRNRSIILTENNTYGVLMKNGDYCIQPIYHEVSRLNATFFIALHSPVKGDLYHHSGKVILKDIIPYEIITNESATFIYQNCLYDEEGEKIAELENIGTDWLASTDLGEYFGLNAANEVIYIDMYGKELLLNIDFETQYFLDQHGDVLITTEHGKTTLTMDGKNFSLDGDEHVLLKRFSNEHFIVRGDWADGNYLWIDRKKKKLQFYQNIICTDDNYVFMQKPSSTFWLAIDNFGKICITEKKQIIQIDKDYDNEQWKLEDTMFQQHLFLPLSKKLIQQQKLMNQFVRKNRIS